MHHMTTNSISSKEITYFEGFKNVSEFEMEFRLRRDSGTYVVTYVVPGLFAVFVSTSQVFLFSFFFIQDPSFLSSNQRSKITTFFQK